MDEPIQHATPPEKPAAARFSGTPQGANQQTMTPAQAHFLPPPMSERPSRPFSVAKVALGVFTLIFAIVELAVGLSTALMSNTYDSIIGIIILLVAAVISMIWQIAEFITVCIRKQYKGIHPGAHVALHLMLWILYVLVAISLGLSLGYTLSDWSIEGEDDNNSSYYYSYDTFPSVAAARTYFKLLETLVAFSVLLFLTHSTLFVMACVECETRRKGRKQPIYVVATQGPGGMMFYAPMPPNGIVQAPYQQPMPMAPQAAHVNGNGDRNQTADTGVYGYDAPASSAEPQMHGAAEMPRERSLLSAGPSSPVQDRRVSSTGTAR